jgi:hypothetical protein
MTDTCIPAHNWRANGSLTCSDAALAASFFFSGSKLVIAVVLAAGKENGWSHASIATALPLS